MTTPLLHRSHLTAVACLLLTLTASTLNAQTTITYTNAENNGTAIDTSPDNHVLTIDSGSATQSGVISGTGTVTKTGLGTLTLSGNNTYEGGTFINEGTLSLGDVNALGTAGTITFGGGTLQFSAGVTPDLSARFGSIGQNYRIDTNGQNVTLASNFTGSSSGFTKTGAGTLTLSGVNTFDGVPYTRPNGAGAGFSARIVEGTLRMGNASALGGGDVIVESGGTLDTASYTFNLNQLLISQLSTGTVTGTGSFTISDSPIPVGVTIAGSASLTTTGSPDQSIILTGNNTYTGGTILSSGILRLNSDNAIGSSGTISFEGGALAFTDQNTTDYSARFSNAADQAYRLLNYSDSPVTLASALTSAGGSLTAQVGLFILAATNTYSGGTFLQESAEITFSSAANFGSGPITVTDGALKWASGTTTDLGAKLNGTTGSEVSLVLDTNGNAVTLTTQFAGGNAYSEIEKIGPGSLTLSSESPFNGFFYVESGDLILGHSNALSSAGEVVITGDSSLKFSGITSATIGGLSGWNPLALQNSNNDAVALTVVNNGDPSNNYNYSGVISGSGSLIINGAAFGLAGANTFTGGVTVQSGGTLHALNSAGSATGSGAVTVQSGGTLAGGLEGFGTSSDQTGFIAGPVTINSGGRIAPGMVGEYEIGTLTFNGGLTLTGGSILDFQLGGPTTTDSMRVASGTFAGPSSGTVTINFSNFEDGFGLGSYTLINYTTATGTSNLSASSFSLGSTVAGYSYGLSLAGSTLQLNVSAIPEPSTYAAIFGAFALGLAIYRRRQASR